MRSSGFFNWHADALEPPPATDEDLRIVHERRYVDAVKELSAHPRPEAHEWGLGPGDNPIFEGMYEAAALQAGGTIAAFEAVATGERRRAYHRRSVFLHAMPVPLSGF